MRLCHFRRGRKRPSLLVCSEFGQSLQDFIRCLHLNLLSGHGLARRRVTGGHASILLGLIEVLDDSLAVLVQGLLGNTFHTEDFNFETLAVGEGIFDLAEGFFVDLVQVYGET